MKLLIRTVTLAAVFVFMMIIILNNMIVEMTKKELETASTNSLYHTVETYEKNQKLKTNGEDNLYFTTDNEYYYYFLDDLLVQLNGNIKIDSTVNYINVDTGDLDIDITVTYMGLDKKERTYTTHVDTYGRINLDSETTISAQASKIKAGDLVKWANKEWYAVENEGENLVLIYAGDDIGTGKFGNSVNYKNSILVSNLATFVNSNVTNQGTTETNINGGNGGVYANELNKITIGDMNLLSGVYLSEGTDTLSASIFALSEKEALELNSNLAKNGYSLSGDYWLRTANSSSEVKVATSGGIINADVNTTHGYRPVVSLNKNKLTSCMSEKNGDLTVYEID